MKEPQTVQDLWEIRRQMAKESGNDIKRYLDTVEDQFERICKKYGMKPPVRVSSSEKR